MRDEKTTMMPDFSLPHTTSLSLYTYHDAELHGDHLNIPIILKDGESFGIATYKRIALTKPNGDRVFNAYKLCRDGLPPEIEIVDNSIHFFQGKTQ